MTTKILHRDAIKCAAMAAMLLNHIAVIFLLAGTLLAEVLTDVGYFTAVTMCFFLVEGYRYTRSKRRYGLRLALFALLSELPFCLAFSGEKTLAFCGMNMLFTLLLCFLLLVVRERVASPPLRVLLLLALTLLSLGSDWALLAPIFTLLFAWAGTSRPRLHIAFLVSALLFGLTSFLGGVGRFPPARNLLLSLGSMAGIFLSAAVLLCFYNGRRARRGRRFFQWFFYLFYPLHLLLLGILRLCL